SGWNDAGYVVLNTCAVTAAAEQDARAAIRRIRRQNPGSKILVTGCYAQRVPVEVAQLPGVFAVVGNSHKPNLAQIALRKENKKDNGELGSFVPLSVLDGSAPAEIFVSNIFAHTELVAAPVFDSANERTRPNLKVQDGCNIRCVFCFFPSVRGRSRSLPAEEVVRQVNELVDAGYREVVISGINLGRWGRDLTHVGPGALAGAGEPCSPVTARRATARVGAPAPTTEDLVRAILDHTSLEKLRVSSVEPMDWSDSFIRLMGDSPRIAKHAHVPMQSGSDTVLRRMHRKYRPWHYREKIEKIR